MKHDAAEKVKQNLKMTSSEQAFLEADPKNKIDLIKADNNKLLHDWFLLYRVMTVQRKFGRKRALTARPYF